MSKFLLIVHVLAAIVAIGPVTVAASMFPPAARRALADPADLDAVSSVRLLHRICRVYSLIALAVPVFGFGTASSMGVLGSPWLIASIVLTACAAGTLVAFVLPRQGAILAGVEGGATGPGAAAVSGVTARLAMFTGVFNLLWALVTVLMIIRPGSTTGA